MAPAAKCVANGFAAFGVCMGGACRQPGVIAAFRADKQLELIAWGGWLVTCPVTSHTLPRTHIFTRVFIENVIRYCGY